MNYQLGSSQKEQHRLEKQALLYNDAQYLQLDKGINVCEFGCGNGANLWVAESIQDGRYIGLDIQEAQITAAKNKAKERKISNSEFYKITSEAVPVDENWADLSFCRLVLVHNSEPIKLLRSMVRVTKAGGKVLAIEPNNLSYIAYTKPYLNKCYHARVNYMYRPSKGCLDICPQLYYLFQQAALENISIKQHSIYYDSRNPDILKAFYENWIQMLEPVKEELIMHGVINQHDYDAAKIEASEITEGDSIYQSLWVADGVKNLGSLNQQ